MTSVNKIKELAEAREYSLAVEILDSQNLEASLNPQFLRICGEVYENVGRYRDARNMYVKAHVMGPESGRIIFSLIRFYLKLGYRKLAELYREQYIASVHGSEQEIRKLSYVLEKARRAPLSELRGYLDPWFIHDMDEEWSFELFLINFMDGQDTEMLASDYRATFRRSRRSEQVEGVLQGRLSAEELFYIYADEEREDKDPEEEDIRRLELEQLKKDYDRLHPDDASIIEDEAEEDDEGEAEILDTPDTETKFKSFLKRKFRKKPKEDEEDSEETEEVTGEAGDGAEADEADKEQQTSGEEEESPAEDGEEPDGEKTDAEPGTDDGEESGQPEKKAGGWVRNLASSISDRGRNREEMQELTVDEDSLLSVDFDDGFAAETDSIADLAPAAEEEYENPFDIINAYRIAENESRSFQIPFETRTNEVVEEEPGSEAEWNNEPETVEEPEAEREAEPEIADEPEPEAVTEEAVIIPETEPEPVNEFRIEPETEPETEKEPEVEWEAEPEIADEPEPEIADEPEPKIADEPEPEPETEAETEPEPEPEPEAEEKPEPETEAEPEPEPEPETETEPEPETETEPEPETETGPEPETEEKPEPEFKTEPEPVKEPEMKKESDFDRQARESNEKLDEGLQEEERLQREAEALLASLGIKL